MMRKDYALGTKAYREILDACKVSLERKQCFECVEILRETDYEPLGKSVRWDWIKEAIRDELDAWLTPVTNLYFHHEGVTDPERDMRERPEAYAAINLSAAGYTLPEVHRGVLTERYVKHIDDGGSAIKGNLVRRLANYDVRRISIPPEYRRLASGPDDGGEGPAGVRVPA